MVMPCMNRMLSGPPWWIAMIACRPFVCCHTCVCVLGYDAYCSGAVEVFSSMWVREECQGRDLLCVCLCNVVCMPCGGGGTGERPGVNGPVPGYRCRVGEDELTSYALVGASASWGDCLKADGPGTPIPSCRGERRGYEPSSSFFRSNAAGFMHACG